METGAPRWALAIWESRMPVNGEFLSQTYHIACPPLSPPPALSCRDVHPLGIQNTGASADKADKKANLTPRFSGALSRTAKSSICSVMLGITKFSARTSPPSRRNFLAQLKLAELAETPQRRLACTFFRGLSSVSRMLIRKSLYVRKRFLVRHHIFLILLGFRPNWGCLRTSRPISVAGSRSSSGRRVWGTQTSADSVISISHGGTHSLPPQGARLAPPGASWEHAA